MAKSTKSSRTNKPKKPYPDFPLFPHATGRWCKKVRGKFHYFGKVADDPKGVRARKLWVKQKDDIEAHGAPRDREELLTIKGLCNAYLKSKALLVESGELSPRTLASYRSATDKIVREFGRNEIVTRLTPQDFEKLRYSLAKGRSPVSLRNDVRHIRMVFRYGYEAGLLDQELRFGPGFKLPTKENLRKARQEQQRTNGKRMFEAEELRSVIEAAGQPMKAMVLLGVNCGLGNTDVSSVPLSAVDLGAGRLDFPRPKNGVERICPLWPETVAALREWLEQRPTPVTSAESDLVFLTKYSQRWVRVSDKGGPIDGVSCEFAKLLKRPRCPECQSINRMTWDAGSNKYVDPESCTCGWIPEEGAGWDSINRPRLNFYALRHTVQTIGEGAKDLPALRMIMGHTDQSISSEYREGISEERLQAVTDFIHNWLWPEGGAK